MAQPTPHISSLNQEIPPQLLQRARQDPRSLTPHEMLHLQSTFGNQWVQQMIYRSTLASPSAQYQRMEPNQSGKGMIQRMTLRAEQHMGKTPEEGNQLVFEEDPVGTAPIHNYYDNEKVYKNQSKVYLIGHGTPSVFDGNAPEDVGERLTRKDKGIDKDSPVHIILISCRTGKQRQPNLGLNFAARLNNSLHKNGYRQVTTSAPKGDFIFHRGLGAFAIDEADVRKDEELDSILTQYSQAEDPIDRESLKQLFMAKFDEYSKNPQSKYYKGATLAELQKTPGFEHQLSKELIEDPLQAERQRQEQAAITLYFGDD